MPISLPVCLSIGSIPLSILRGQLPSFSLSLSLSLSLCVCVYISRWRWGCAAFRGGGGGGVSQHLTVVAAGLEEAGRNRRSRMEGWLCHGSRVEARWRAWIQCATAVARRWVQGASSMGSPFYFLVINRSARLYKSWFTQVWNLGGQPTRLR